jgi:hypothetical protein
MKKCGVKYIIEHVDINDIKQKIKRMGLNTLFIAVEDLDTVIITFDRHLTDAEERILYEM